MRQLWPGLGRQACARLAGEDKYRVLVITGASKAAREYYIKVAGLNKKIAAFLELLHNREWTTG